ncbi:MAG: hypothetical protein JRH07_13045 [Deltaproteobacteria bacterium]|nr:hypothetical protein [Deltaproteobacteria bacterium]
MAEHKGEVERAILVCDRGMVSVENLIKLEEARLEYIVGTPLRRYVDIEEEVLSDCSSFHEVADDLWVKQVIHGGLRYIVCHNPRQAERDRKQREIVVSRLRQTLASKGPKALVGKRGYQRFLKMDRTGTTIYILRTDFRGSAHKVFQAVGVRPPPTLQAFEDQKM